MRDGRRPKKLPTVLTDEELVRYLGSFDQKDESERRNYLVVKLMADTGLRISEALNLKVNDLDFDSGKALVREGKGKVDRYIFLSEEDASLIMAWLKSRLVKSPLVFCTSSGLTIRPSYFWEVVKRHAVTAGIKKSIHPHTMRHSFATSLYRQTKDIRLVQKALAHQDISVTMIYTHIEDSELEAAMKNLRTQGVKT